MRAGREHSAWGESVDSVLKGLAVEAAQGLAETEAAERRRVFGRNLLQATRKRHVTSILAEQFSGIVVILLLAAGVLALFMGNLAEAIAIFAVILINSSIGFLIEWRAIRSMEALRKFAKVSCVVIRDGIVRRTAAEELVPGDIVLLDAGDMVPADLRVIDAEKLEADESTMTGESLPVGKLTDAVAGPATMFERKNMLYKGTAVTRGSARGVVVATGMETEFGKIFEHVSEAQPHQTPLEKRLDALGTRLAWVVIIIGVLLAVIGVLAGRGVYLAVETAVALAVAAIPEGLPIVATIALARGLWRMARRNAIITRLSAVETLGATSVILTDKTGTLTENHMTVTSALLPDRQVELDEAPDDLAALDEMLTTAALCNGAVLQRDSGAPTQAVGTPTECALLEAAARRDIWREDLLRASPEMREDPFDSDTKIMATMHEYGNEIIVAVKGAPEIVMDYCVSALSAGEPIALSDAHRQEWLERIEGLCAEGKRTIAVAKKSVGSVDAEFYKDLVLQGVFGLEDPPRAGIDEAIERCHEASIAVVMVTGDHAVTARHVAIQLGLADETDDASNLIAGVDVDRLFEEECHEELLAARVFSRVTPEQKLRLIDLHQQQGQIVAMTGDGINDAPALKKADIGVAMGIRGTAVAKEAAEMVLQDDDFGTIVAAVGHGRAIFENIRKFVVYLLSCNTSEILVVTLATVAGAPLPLLPLQILFLNLVTDVFPALALGVGPGRPGLMQQGPRPSGEPILPRPYWIEIGLYGVVIAVVTLAAMAFAILQLDFDAGRAVTVAFGTIALAQLWHVFNMRGDMKRVVNNEITRNVWIWAAIALCIVLILAAIYVPVLSDVLRLPDPGANGWLVILVASLVPLFVAPLVRSIGSREMNAKGHQQYGE
mgnify:CR=1 FL=1